MREYKVDWRIVTTDFKRIDGVFHMPEPVEIPNLEQLVFAEAAKCENVDRIYVRLSLPDSSGHVRYYARRGEVFVLLGSDNILPWWFPLFFFGLLIGGFILLGILAFYRMIP